MTQQRAGEKEIVLCPICGRGKIIIEEKNTAVIAERGL